MDVQNIIEKLKVYSNTKTDSALAATLGISRSTISTWKSRNSIDMVLVKQALPSISIDWLLDKTSFDLPEFTYSDYKSSQEELKNAIITIETLKTSSDMKKTDGKNCTHRGVPYYPIDVTGSIIRSFNDIEEKPEFYVDYQPFNDCVAYFPVFGDSMFPMFASGEVIAVKQIANYNVILWGEAYMIVTSEEANSLRTVKLVFPCEDDVECIVLRSSNPSYKGDIKIRKEYVITMYIIKGKITQRLM